MAEPTLTYRLWQNGKSWHWQVISEVEEVVASGQADSSTAARGAAFSYCLKREHDQLKP